MVIKLLENRFNNIIDESHTRFDAKFYWLEEFFLKIKRKGQLNVLLLGDLKDKISSGSYIEEYIKKNQGIPYIRVSDIKSFLLDETEVNYEYVNDKVNEKMKVKEGDILIARTGAKVEFLGKASLIDNFTQGWAISQHVTKISINKTKISPGYVLAFFNSRPYKIQMALASHGNTRVEFTHSQMDRIKIIIPSKTVENNITKKVQEIIKLNRESLKLLEEAKNYLRKEINLKINKDYTRSFTITKEELKKDSIWTSSYSHPDLISIENYLVKSFQTISLSKIADTKRGSEPGSDIYKFYLESNKNDIPYIRTSDLINYEVDRFPDYFIEENIYHELNQDLKEGDILFTKDGKIGMIAMVTKQDRALISSGILRIRLIEKEAKKYNLTPEYLFTLLSLEEIGLSQAKRRTVLGMTIPHLREDKINEFIIPILDKEIIEKVTLNVKSAFNMKDLKKKDSRRYSK